MKSNEIKSGELILIWAGGDMDYYGPGTPYRACQDFYMEDALQEFQRVTDTSGSPISRYVQFENWLVVKKLARPLPYRDIYLGSYGRWQVAHVYNQEDSLMGSEVKFEVVEWAIERGSDQAYITVEASLENFRCTFVIPVHRDDCGKFLAAGDALKNAVSTFMSAMRPIL